jgi:hypothetical protein
LGDAIWEYYHYMNIWGKAKKKKDVNQAWSNMKDAEEKILRVAENALRRGYSIGPSTHLADYTPEPEHTTTTAPLLDCPVVQVLPAFSSINESNIRHAAPVALTGHHDWGEIDERATLEFFKTLNNGRPITFNDLKYDMERYNHEGGPVVIGIHQANGRYVWFVFTRQANGKYAPASGKLNNQTELLNNGNTVQTTDVRYEGQGRFIIREYEGGIKRIFNTSGEPIVAGTNVGLLHKQIDGKQLLYQDWSEDMHYIYDETGKNLFVGKSIEQYDDALVVNTLGGHYAMYNWRGERLELDDVDYFQEINAYNNGGSYYVLRDRRHGYAVMGRGFKRVGGWYSTPDEAHRAWQRGY